MMRVLLALAALPFAVQVLLACWPSERVPDEAAIYSPEASDGGRDWPTIIITLAYAALAALLLLAGSARAHDMNKPDLDGWYASLQTKSGGSCCNMTDCKETEYRIGPDGYEALIDERFPGVKGASWVKVPDDHALARENPTGSAVACWWGGEVRCLVPQSLF